MTMMMSLCLYVTDACGCLSSVDHTDPLLGASALYTKRLAKMAGLQEKNKAAERKRLWVAAIKSVKRSTKTKSRLSKSSK